MTENKEHTATIIFPLEEGEVDPIDATTSKPLDLHIQKTYNTGLPMEALIWDTNPPMRKTYKPKNKWWRRAKKLFMIHVHHPVPMIFADIMLFGILSMLVLGPGNGVEFFSNVLQGFVSNKIVDGIGVVISLIFIVPMMFDGNSNTYQPHASDWK